MKTPTLVTPLRGDDLILLATAGALPAHAEGLREKVIGSWSLVSLTVVQGDKRIELFGPDPRGIQLMQPDGRFVNVITRSRLPLSAGGNRMKGTDEEYRAIGQGFEAFFGTYTVDEEKNEIVFNIEVSTFPNWEGVEQRRVSTIEGDTWRYVNPMTPIGEGVVEVVCQRLH